MRIWNFAVLGVVLLACGRSNALRDPALDPKWNSATLQGIRDAKLGAPVVARALAIVHTCMYDAWAAYDERAVGTQLGGALRRPASERTLANKEQAISYAAYRALVDVLPVDTNSVYIPLMKQLGYDPNDNSTDIETPTGIGNVACAAVLEYRHHDKSNQLGDLAQGPYSDWTGYVPVNTPSPVPARAAPSDPNHWQPLTYVNSTGDLMTQRFVGAQWCARNSIRPDQRRRISFADQRLRPRDLRIEGVSGAGRRTRRHQRGSYRQTKDDRRILERRPQQRAAARTLGTVRAVGLRARSSLAG